VHFDEQLVCFLQLDLKNEGYFEEVALGRIKKHLLGSQRATTGHAREGDRTVGL
jgi:hypothetical protein